VKFICLQELGFRTGCHKSFHTKTGTVNFSFFNMFSLEMIQSQDFALLLYFFPFFLTLYHFLFSWATSLSDHPFFRVPFLFFSFYKEAVGTVRTLIQFSIFYFKALGLILCFRKLILQTVQAGSTVGQAGIRPHEGGAGHTGAHLLVRRPPALQVCCFRKGGEL
jgi:hypothetical protein